MLPTGGPVALVVDVVGSNAFADMEVKFSLVETLRGPDDHSLHCSSQAGAFWVVCLEPVVKFLIGLEGSAEKYRHRGDLEFSA